MSHTLKAYRIFIASPGGLESERKAFSEVVEEYNVSCARKRGVVFEPIGWEITLAGAGRPQELINKDVRSCDYFFMVLHDRWGQPTDAGDKPKYKSGTHEEYCVAFDCYRDGDSPMRQLVLLFKAVDPSKLADPGPQLQQVLDFRREIESKKEFLFSTFDELRLFEKLVRRQLDQWLFDHEQGRGNDKAGPQSPPPPSPDSTEARSSTDVGSTTLATLELSEEAERLADEGKLVDAETKFAEAIVKGNDLDALNRYGHFLARLGRLGQASVMYRRVTELAELTNEDKWRAIGYGNLGLIYQTRGDLDLAEEMHKKSLAIEEQLGRKEGMASGYGNLGLIYQTRGDLDLAEEMHKKSLEISKQLGRKEGMANGYGNLGLIYQTRGDLDLAEEMHKKSLVIEEQLGRKEGMANDYGNLGLIYRTRGDLDLAEEMHKKSLVINEQLGRKEGIARDYGNLGLIYETRGDLDLAEEMHKKSLEINEQLGRKAGIAIQYGNLGLIYQRRGDLDLAEEMLKKSLEINEQLGRKEGMANQYGNLGVIYQTRGDLDRAREYWTRSHNLFAEIGMPFEVRKVEGWIDELPGGSSPVE